MNLGWMWRRLRAMPPEEILLRLRRKLRDRLVPPLRRRLSPDRAFGNYFQGDVFGSLTGGIPEGILRLLEGPPSSVEMHFTDTLPRFHLFGTEVVLDAPPDWHRNYISGARWPETEDLDFHRSDLAGGPKWVWEINRHSVFSALAHRYYLTADETLAQKLLSWMSDWVDRNPPGRGINWTSALEMAVRLIVWSWCLRMVAIHPEGCKLLRSSAAEKAMGSLGQQAEYIRHNFSYGSSGNNHLIGEVCALATFCTLWPNHRHGREWLPWALSIAEQECLHQISADGVSLEQSFHYIPFVWEFYLHMVLAGIQLSSKVIERLDATLRFVDAIATCSGFVPQIGDEDDGTVLRQIPGGWPRFGIIGGALSDALGIRRIVRPHRGYPESAVVVFPEGGYTVFRTGPPEIHVLFDHGPLGFGSLAAHGHADALSITVTVDGQPLLVDPGCYTYHDEPAWRDYFRSTAAHNTVAFDGRSQAEMLGPFLWGRRYRVEAVPGCPHTYCIPGRSAPGYDATHQRAVRLEGRRLLVQDRIDGAYGTAVASWHCHPDIEVSRTKERELVLARDNRPVARITLEFEPTQLKLVRGDPSEGRAGPGWYSPGLGQKKPTTSILIGLPRSPNMLTTRLDFD